MERGDGRDAYPGELGCSGVESPQHKVMVSDFYLDEFEVTMGRFRRYLEGYEKPVEGAGAHPKIPGSGWKSEWDVMLYSSNSLVKCDFKRQT